MEKAWVGYLSSLRLMMEQGTDVSKTEDNASGDGLTGVAAAEQSISITHRPARTVLLEFTSFPPCTHNMLELIQDGSRSFAFQIHSVSLALGYTN